MTSVERRRDKLEFPRNVDEIVIDEEFLNSLIAKAERDDRKRHLELLHEGDFETCHRMINAMLPETEVTVHMHPSRYQTELYLPLKGKAVVVSFTSEGEIDDFVLFGEEFGQKLVEIKPETWHTIIPLTPFVMLEVKGQPEGYEAKNDKVFAPWAPLEGDSQLKDYIQDIKTKIRGRIE